MTSLGLEKPTLIMDRGFFSGTNIHDLTAAKYNFIIPAPLSLKSIKSLISTCQKDLENTQYLQKYEGEMVFVKPVTLEFDDLKINGYLYYDLRREQEEKSLFYERLHDTIDRLQNRTLRKWDRPDKVFEDIAKSQTQYLDWKVKGDRFIVSVRQNAVSQRLNRAGKMVILYSGEQSWDEVLGWNRERDVIEKMFSIMKSDLEILPLRAHKREVVVGMVFVTFISLILRTRIRAILKDTGLNKEYSMTSLLLELSKLKRIELADGSMINTQMTKKQRNCFERMGITVE
jgi:transposase